MRIWNYIYALFALSLLISCRHSAGTGIDAFDLNIYTPSYAGGFSITGTEGSESVIISTVDPWQGADSVTTRLFIARNGERPPEGFEGESIDGNAGRLIVMSHSYIAMLDAVDATDAIAGVSNIGYVSNPYIQARCDSIGDVGYEGNVNYELLVSLEPDLVLLYGLNSPSPMVPKLKELGIPYMYVADYLETSPLGKAEWMVALAEVVGKRDDAISKFSRIPERYDSLRHMVADKALDAPTVMLNTPYRDSWFMPSTKSYIIQLITDAGGNYVYPKNNGNESMRIDMEQAYQLASQADMWLDLGTANSVDDLKAMCPKFTDTRCFRNGYLYNNNRRTNAAGGNDYYESGIMNPDLILRDLIKIFHPELVEDDFVYYKQLHSAT